MKRSHWGRFSFRIRWIGRRISRGVAVVFCVSLVPLVFAANAASPPMPTETEVGSCTGHLFNPVTDICWGCFFPLTWGTVPMVRGHHADTPNSSSPLCHCGALPWRGWGIPMGYWVPQVLMDVTRHPYCMVSLGGISTSVGPALGEGGVAQYNQDNHSFYYLHAYRLPSLSMLPSFSVWPSGMQGCNEPSQPYIGAEYLSELDPIWNHEGWSAVLSPEMIPVIAALKLSPLGVMASEMADCAAATVYLPLDTVYWNAGCHGPLYPLEGVVGAHVDGVQASTLIAERGLIVLHRLQLLRDSDKNRLCGEHATLWLPKSRYRVQRVYPLGALDCAPLGGMPGYGLVSENLFQGETEDYAYLFWKKRNCCASH